MGTCNFHFFRKRDKIFTSVITIQRNKTNCRHPLICPGNPSRSAVASIIDLDNKMAKIRTKASLVANDLRGQTVSVGSNPNGRKQTYANIIANKSRNDVVCEASRTWVNANTWL